MHNRLRILLALVILVAGVWIGSIGPTYFSIERDFLTQLSISLDQQMNYSRLLLPIALGAEDAENLRKYISGHLA